jgi:phosphatidylglycerophosphate synthase
MLGSEARKKMDNFSNKLGIVFSRFGSPNFYTFLTLLTGFAAAYVIYQGEFIFGIALILVSGFFDLLDGAVARAIKGTTKWGAMADSVTDKVTEIAIYFALALYSSTLFLGSMLAITAFMLSSYISKHAGALGAKQGGGLIERKERIFLIFVGLVLIYIDIKYMRYILYIIAGLSALTALQRLNRSRKAFKAAK